MKNQLILFLMLLIMFNNGFQNANGDDRPQSIRVLWTVNKYVILDKSKVSETEAQAFIFKPLDISEDSITFDGNTCSNVTFIEHDVNAKDYFSSNFHVVPQDIGIDDSPLKLVRTSCELPGFSEYFRLHNRKIVVFRNGVFLFFSPRVNY
jgi:hypothetical protein